MGLTYPVDSRRVKLRGSAVRLVFFYHLFSASGVAGQRKAVERSVGSDDPRFDERARERDKSARVASRDGDAFAGPDLIFKIGSKLRKAVRPRRESTSRSRGVDDDGAVVFYKRDRLARGVVRQAQERDVARIYRVRPRARILAYLIRESDQFDVVALFDPLAEPQSRRTVRAVDEYLYHLFAFFLSTIA